MATGVWRALMAAMLAVCCASLAAQEFPAPVGKVNDFARLLPPEDRQEIETLLNDLERATSAEVAVVTIVSLEGRIVEDYANRLFEAWGIGKKGQDNGVLILVARDEREMRIEAGYGLEGVLPDGLAGAIIRESFVPRFQAGDYPAGIREGTARVADVIRRNHTLTDAERAALDQQEAMAGQSWGVAVFLSLFVGIGAFTAGTSAGARVVVQMLFGLAFTGMALFMALMGSPFPAVVLLALFAIVILVVGYRLGRRPSWQRSIRGSGARAGGSGWMLSGAGGGGSSSRSGGSGSSSGGFGGGRSGGGGASGRW